MQTAIDWLMDQYVKNNTKPRFTEVLTLVLLILN